MVRTTSIKFEGVPRTVHTRNDGGTQDDFIIDSGAAVTVTNRKELISDIVSFMGIILIDGGGTTHQSQGVGAIQAGGTGSPVIGHPHCVSTRSAPRHSTNLINPLPFTQMAKSKKSR
ncbi:hypothetical protein JCM33374_g39 [Metschnikowia sp. JCM 33374]|nr:hypothetical protein JCM33374_g39 [Metschnikowia sp. JCM 33374]